MNKNIINFFKRQLEKAGYHVTKPNTRYLDESELTFPGFYNLSETDSQKLSDLMQFGSIVGKCGQFILGELSVLVGRCGTGKTSVVQKAIRQFSSEKRMIVFTGPGEDYSHLVELKPFLECYSTEDIVESPVEFATFEDWKREPKEIYLEKLMSTKGVELVVIESDCLFTLDNHTLNLILSLSIGYGVRTCLVTSDLNVIPKLFELGNVDLSKLTMTVEGLLND